MTHGDASPWRLPVSILKSQLGITVVMPLNPMYLCEFDTSQETNDDMCSCNLSCMSSSASSRQDLIVDACGKPKQSRVFPSTLLRLIPLLWTARKKPAASSIQNVSRSDRRTDGIG